MLSLKTNKNFDDKIKEFDVSIIDNKSNYYIVSYQKQKYFLNKKYYKNNIVKTINCEIDDELIITGKIQPLPEINNFYDFNFKLFLNAENVNQQIKIKYNSSAEIIKHFSIRNSILEYINNMPDLIKNYTSLLLFQKNDSNEIFKIFSSWGIVAILVISGFHINIFFLFLNKILKFIHHQKSRSAIIISILLFYLYILNWPIAALRAFVTIFIIFLAQLSGRKINNISIFAVTTYVCLLINPVQFYQLGCQLSFGTTIIILFVNEKIKLYHKYKKILLFSFIIFSLNIPVQLLINHEISLYSVFYSIIFTPIIIFYYFLLIFNLLISPLININVIIIFFLKSLIKIFHFFQLIDIKIFGFQPEVWMLEVFFLIIFVCYFLVKFFNWKLWLSLLINYLLIFSVWINHFNTPYYEINMINVGNAMSILITSPFNENAVLVDAGLEPFSNINIIYNYLKAKGIQSIDAIFLTHKDSDHTNNFNYLNSHLKIKKLYNNQNILQFYQINNFGKVYNLSYQIAQETSNSTENNRSLVLLFYLYNFKFMITGDIEKFSENLLLNKHLVPQVDFLQIAHHGSKTSSSLSFLKKAKPKVAIISGHHQKIKHFPDVQTLNKLKMLRIPTYWTGKNKTIVIRVFLNSYKIVTLQ